MLHGSTVNYTMQYKQFEQSSWDARQP